MEYKLESYRRHNGQNVIAADGHKYIRRKYTETAVYLKCALFRDGCKATAKLNRETDLITPGNVHNHNLKRYNSSTFQLKSKCKTIALTSQVFLMKLREMILLQLRYRSVNANLQCIAQEGDHRPKYLQMLYNYLICYRQLPLESSIKQQFH